MARKSTQWNVFGIRWCEKRLVVCSVRALRKTVLFAHSYWSQRVVVWSLWTEPVRLGPCCSECWSLDGVGRWRSVRMLESVVPGWSNKHGCGSMIYDAGELPYRPVMQWDTIVPCCSAKHSTTAVLTSVRAGLRNGRMGMTNATPITLFVQRLRYVAA